MNCTNPKLIYNRYLQRFLYVGCGCCDNCRIDKQNGKADLLRKQMAKYKYNAFCTLTYDNEHIPYIINGFPGIYRGLSNPECIEETEDIFGCYNGHPITGFKDTSCYAVLYYRDVQLFLKRLRKKFYVKYGKYVNFSYHCIGEYGSRFQRSHFHIVFSFSRKEYFEFAESVAYSCWKMCDKTRFDFSYTSGGCCNYVSSYVCGSLCRHGVQQIERFRQKTWRSKNIDYGVTEEEYESIHFAFEFFRDEFKRMYSGLCSSKFGFRYLGNVLELPEGLFEYDYQDVKNRCVSSRLVQKRLLSYYCQQPKGTSDVSFDSFYQVCRDRIYWLRGDVSSYFSHIDSSSDLGFYRSYKRYLNRFLLDDSDDNFHEFVFVIYQMNKIYNLLVLKKFMNDYYDVKNPSAYLESSYQTWTDITLKQYRVDRYLSEFCCPSDFAYPLGSLAEWSRKGDFRFRHRKKLLPKHVNSLYLDI